MRLKPLRFCISFLPLLYLLSDEPWFDYLGSTDVRRLASSRPMTGDRRCSRVTIFEFDGCSLVHCISLSGPDNGPSGSGAEQQAGQQPDNTQDSINSQSTGD